MIICSSRHKSMKKVPLCILILVVKGLTIFNVFGLTRQERFYPDTFINKVYLPDIHTVLLRSASWELSSPVIETGSEQKLELHFDDLSATRRNFGYTMIHCDANWKSSDLSPQEYLSGFGHGVIRESSSSFNTTYDYMHYHLTFPEEDCSPVISGNYALVVYDEDDPAKIILIRRFYVTEKTVELSARIKQPPPGEFRETGQQVEFSVHYDIGLIRDPLNDLTVVIKQNNRDDNALTLKKPTFSQPGQLEYTNESEGIFPGGNEFRSLDLKSIKYQTENMAAIDFQNPYYHVYLKTDEDRGNKPYFSKTDLNGGYFIDREKSDDKHTEADYIYVHFSFAPPTLYSGENIFVTGAFCEWAVNKENKMNFNPDKDCFEITQLLKQGLYDYCYAMTDPQTRVTNENLFEGNYYETANEYAIFVYYFDRQHRYDRLMGYLPLK